MYNYIFFILISLTVSSCVSTKVFSELQNKHDELKIERDYLVDSLQDLSVISKYNLNKIDFQKTEIEQIRSENQQLKQDYTAVKDNIEVLQTSYDLLEENRNSEIVKNSQENKKLLQLLNEKQKILYQKESLLEETKKQLKDRSDSLVLSNQKLSQRAEELEHLKENLHQDSKKIEQLKNLINKRNDEASSLKNKISKALQSFQEKGLTVKGKDGKIYISLENQLLFTSGEYDIELEGYKIIQRLGSALEGNPDISIQIEGHTDNIPFVSNGIIDSNWDLSAKRAISVVETLVLSTKINPRDISAVARGQYDPIASNKTREGRAENRRIDIVITPKLDLLEKLLKNNNNEIHEDTTNDPESQ